MILNTEYYEKLSKQYGHSIADITVSIALKQYSKESILFNFSYLANVLQNTISLFFIKLTKNIFNNYADYPNFNIGDKWKLKNGSRNDIYTIRKVNGCIIHLKNEAKGIINREVKDENLIKTYTEVAQNGRNLSINNYEKYFEKSNNHGFLPTKFSKKVVFIASKEVWDNLKYRQNIPCIYLPSSHNKEQTQIKSIPALTDNNCIAYFCPKYHICYEQILEKKIKVDTIVVCDTDLESIQQIINDKNLYGYKLIILSQKKVETDIACWNWFEEEMELIEPSTKHLSVKIEEIADEGLNQLIQKFDSCIAYISDLDIQLKNYGYFLRLALSNIQPDDLDYLISRLEQNTALERNENGYPIEYLGENNPKIVLLNIFKYLKINQLKKNKLLEYLKKAEKYIIIADLNDINFLQKENMIENNTKIDLLTHSEIKKADLKGKTLVFYSFNGQKDFNFICNQNNNIVLILHEQEKQCYYKELQGHKTKLEREIMSDNRYKLCGIKYESEPEIPFKASFSLEQIISRLDDFSDTAYNGYKDENDSILDELAEETSYRITFSTDQVIDVGTNDTVFNYEGNLVKISKVKPLDNIRIYPKKDLAENLFQIAVETEPNIFGKVEDHAKFWLRSLKELNQKYPNREELYNQLKNNGLKVLPATVDTYFQENRKFPMYNTDLKAILILAKQEDKFEALKKSKRLYNSTMIALGRGIKQELRSFLRDKIIGDILQKRKFTWDTLNKFIQDEMPLLTVTNIQIIQNENTQPK